MALEQNLAYNSYSIPANSDLSASQYCFVTINSSGRVVLSGVAENSDGVLQDKPTAVGMTCIIANGGVSKVKASAAIAVGAKISTAANGKARLAVTGDYIQGTALEAASAVDQIISVLLHAGGKL